MNSFFLILALAAPFVLLGALITALILTIGGQTKRQ
jgi:hypothetical protein